MKDEYELELLPKIKVHLLFPISLLNLRGKEEALWEHANKVLIKVIGKFVKLPQLFHFFVVNDLH